MFVSYYCNIVRNRDITQRGRDIEGVLKQYSTMVKPSYSNYIAPTMAHADIIVPRGGENKVAIQLIVQHVHTQLQLVIRTNDSKSADVETNRLCVF